MGEITKLDCLDPFDSWERLIRLQIKAVYLRESRQFSKFIFVSSLDKLV